MVVKNNLRIFLLLLGVFNTNLVLGVELLESKNTLLDKLEQILSAQKEDKPGLSVLVRKDDELILKFSKGLANKAKNLSIKSDTGFRIGSISKPFTALAIMQLVEQEKLNLTDHVTQYLRELPSNWNNITIHHLLSHRVSLSNDFFSDSNINLANLSTNKDVINFLSKSNIKVKAQDFDQAVYCNSCYVLLAEIIAKVSGSRFSEYVYEHIFEPANMKNSYIVEKGDSIKVNDALNYATSETFFGINQFTTGAMAQISSIEDLNNFIVALKKGHIISHQSLNLMTKIHSKSSEEGSFGLGWIIGWGEEPFYSHGGSQDGYQAELFFYPKHNLEVAILSNGGDNTYGLQAKIMRAIVAQFN